MVDVGVCVSTANVQLFCHIFHSSPFVVLNQRIDSFVCHTKSGQMSQTVFISDVCLPLGNLATQWYTFLCKIQFYPYWANIIL
jgi:hypothetical protein